MKLKRSVIKEELVILTGSFERALILNQFLYWTERVYDFDKMIAEENQRRLTHGIEEQINLNNGWIYKSAEELNEEIMINKSPATILKHLDVLISNGWIRKRNNPNFKWDRTYQYRVNLVKLQADLHRIGCPLDGFKKISSALNPEK